MAKKVISKPIQAQADGRTIQKIGTPIVPFNAEFFNEISNIQAMTIVEHEDGSANIARLTCDVMGMPFSGSLGARLLGRIEAKPLLAWAKNKKLGIREYKTTNGYESVHTGEVSNLHEFVPIK